VAALSGFRCSSVSALAIVLATVGVFAMNEKSTWPSYKVGPAESIFAIGVASIKYAQLEYILSVLFRHVLEISIDETSRFLARTRNTDTVLSLMTARINSMYLPDDVRERLTAFISGFRTCAQNRNLLMHSNVRANAEQAISLFKTNAEGKMILCRPTIAELRKVADDMHVFFQFGIMLENALTAHGGDYTEHPASSLPWPNIPAAPKLLDYKSPGWPENA
jgi:hypothetical protein